MARARVELKAASTHTRGSKTITRGSPQIIEDEAEIDYYKKQGGFAVTMLADPKAADTKQDPRAPVRPGARPKVKGGDEEDAPL